jgi:hypothetical protein
LSRIVAHTVRVTGSLIRTDRVKGRILGMARLVLADRAQIDSITRESYTLWGGGLSYEGYRDLWEEVGRCRWAQEHARYYVWLGADGRVLSSMKVYRPRLRLLGHEGRVSVLGAIFTPRLHRRQGHAADMVRSALLQIRDQGDLGAMLFSDIGTHYYTGLGFEALPAVEHSGRLPLEPGDGQSDLTLRPAREEEIDLFRAAHDAQSTRRSVAILRDREHWEFLWIRSRSFFSRVQDRTVRHRWSVALRDDSFVGYLITVEGRGEWNVREVGAIDAEPETMREILCSAAVRAHREGLRRVFGWLPQELVECLSGWSIRSRPRRRAVPMLRVDDTSFDLRLLNRPSAAYIPFHDQF